MGVDGLYRFINKNFPDIFNTVGIADIKGKSCIIDGMQHIYGQLIYMRSRDKEIISSQGKNISHIHGLINSLTYYLKNGIIPIFVFDGKTPDIKRNKIEERKKNLKENLIKLKNLQEQKDSLSIYINSFSNEQDLNDIEKENDMVFGTPPVDTINIEEELLRMHSIQEEYKKIYKKSIVMKDYYIKDWIQILELLGLPVIKASGEADPLCAYMLKKNPDIYGIISDDSDMLVFGSPILMRKSINQQFTIIELKSLLNKIEYFVSVEFGKYIEFGLDNLVDFSILLGTDYGTFLLNNPTYDSNEILKYFIKNDKDYRKIISEDQYENFEIIKKYYTEENFGKEYDKFLEKPKWEKPNLLELKKRLLELDVDEDYIDKNNTFLDLCYNKIKKGKIFKNYENTSWNSNNYNQEKRRFRSNSFDNKKSYGYGKSQNQVNFSDYSFKRLSKNPTFYSDKSHNDSNTLEIKYTGITNSNITNSNITNSNITNNSIEQDFKLDTNNKLCFENTNDTMSSDSVENDTNRDSVSSIKNDESEMFYFEN